MECIFIAFGGTILEMYMFGIDHGGAFVDPIYVSVYPIKLWICHWSY